MEIDSSKERNSRVFYEWLKEYDKDRWETNRDEVMKEVEKLKKDD